MSQLSKNEFADIPDDDPWKNDKLERKAVAEHLTPVLASIRQPFVVSLHSPYGTGKSYFLKAWKTDLDEKGFHTALFNAWETDFTQDPLSAFMSSINRQLVKEQTGVAAEKFEELKKGASRFFRKQAAPLLAQALLRKAVGDELAKEFKESFALDEEALAGLAGALATEALEGQEQAEQSMADFKSGLEEVVESLVGNEEDIDKKKVIIFVDELDRCRPTYAIEVLECIKHFFSVPGLVFVIAIDDAQLRRAIESVYGSNFDSEGYLRRFFDWRFELPEASSVSFSRFLTDKFNLTELFDDGQRQKSLGVFREVFGAFSSALGLSLRDQERSMSEIALALRYERNWKEAILLACGVLGPLRVKRGGDVASILESHDKLEAYLEELEEKLKGIFSEQTRFEWKNIKPYIHNAFLDDQAYSDLTIEHTKLREEVSESTSRGENPTHSIGRDERADYLADLLRLKSQDSHQLHGEQTWAKMADSALSGASRYLKQ